jgi:hypothetical protein
MKSKNGLRGKSASVAKESTARTRKTGFGRKAGQGKAPRTSPSGPEVLKDNAVTLGIQGVLIETLTDSPHDREVASSDRKIVHMVREQAFDPQTGQDLRIVAVDGKKYSGEAYAVMPEVLQLFWNSQLNGVRSPNPDILHAAGTIWRSMGLSANPLWSSRMLDLNDVDLEMCQAFQAALFQTWNTSEFGCDLSTTVTAIGSFVHAHPAFKDRLAISDFELPFRDNTAWALCTGIRR